MQYITPRDWTAAMSHFRDSGPFHYVVIDDFLTPFALQHVRQQMLSSVNWQLRQISRTNGAEQWLATQHYAKQPPLPELREIAKEFADCLAVGEVVNFWAIACHRNDGAFPHCDGGISSLNLWLTPDKYNADNESGGMLLYDVKRTEEMLPFEYASEQGGCVRYVNEHKKCSPVRVPYRFNRAVFFDAWTFHATDLVRFHGADASTGRLNLTYTFERSPQT